MQALELKRQFASLSGRYDLLAQDFTTDRGALFFINAGQMLLDLLQDHQQTEAWHYEGLLTGDSIVEVPSFRTIEELWLVSSEARLSLERKSLKWIRDNYSGVSGTQTAGIAEDTLVNQEWVGADAVTQPAAASRIEFIIRDATSSLTAGTVTIVGVKDNGDNQTETISCVNGAGFYRSAYRWTSITSITTAGFTVLGGEETLELYYPAQSRTGTPLYYAPIPVNASPSMLGTKVSLLAGQYDFGGLHFSEGGFQDAENYHGIIIAPALDQAYTLEGRIRFFSKAFSADTDQTYWSVRFPHILLHAALAMHESFHRNSEGFRDSLLTVNMMLAGIDNDLASGDDWQPQIGSTWGAF